MRLMRKVILDLGRVLGLSLMCGLLGWGIQTLWPIKLSAANLVSVRKISLAEFQTLFSNHSATILDARTKGFYQLGHIPGALNLSRKNFEKDLIEIRKQKLNLEQRKIVVYCSGNDCEDSRVVAEKLWNLGVTNVSIFEGGWEEWEAAGLSQEEQ